MTLTAMRPERGLENGHEVSLLSVAQASSLISALRVVLREPNIVHVHYKVPFILLTYEFIKQWF